MNSSQSGPVFFIFQVADLKTLKEALISNNQDLCCKLRDKYSRKLNLNQSFPRSDKLKQDQLAQSLIPCDAPTGLIAHEVAGDGNCLYHAISLALVGTTEYSTCLRILTAIELFENTAYYGNHPRFREALQCGCPFGEVTVFTLALKENGIAEWEHSGNRESAIQSEAIGGCQLGEWSSLMHIMALSTVISRPVFTIYPSCAEAIRPLLHGLVKPRINRPDVFSNNDCFHILWSRDGGLDSRPNAIYVPNHFVPLFKKEYGDHAVKTAKDYRKVADQSTKKASPPKRSFSLEDFWFPTECKKKKRNEAGINNKRMKMGDDGKTEKKTEDKIKMKEKMLVEEELKIQDDMKMEKELKMQDETKMTDEFKMQDETDMEGERKMEDERKMKDDQGKMDARKMAAEKNMEGERKVKSAMTMDDKRKIEVNRKIEEDGKDESDRTRENHANAMDKRKEYEQKRTRSFQWKWLQAHSWLRINLVRKDTMQPFITNTPYPNSQPVGTAVKSMYCGVCSKHPSLASKDSEIAKRSGSSNFKNETLKKHETSQNHKKCIAADKAINDPKKTEMYKCCKQLYEKEDEKMEKKFKTAFYISALERPLDDYESLCALQKLNGVELGETYLTRSACTEFIEHISSVMKEDLADKLKECNFFSLMIDGSTDHGVIEEAIMYVRYLEKSVGRPVTAYLGIEEPKAGTGRGYLDAVDSCFQRVTNMNSVTWKEKITGLGTDGCAAMTGEKNGVVGLLRQENREFMGFWCGAHKLELAVVKCLEKYPDFVKVRDVLRSLYQEYHYSAKALRELRELAEALDNQISKPTNVFGARWLPHLQTALQVLFRGYKTLMMHCQNTREMRVGSSGRQGRASFSVKFLTSFRGLLFTSFLWDIAEEAAHLSKVFQAEFLTVTTAAAAVRKFELQCLNMKSLNGPRLEAFLKEAGDGSVFREIEIKREDNDIEQFEKIRKSVLDEIGQSMGERFHYLFNDPVVKASSVLDPDTWPTDPEELASYGCDQLCVIANRYQEQLQKAGFKAESVSSEWQGVKSLVSLMKHKTTPDIYSVLFSKQEEFPNFLLIAEIVFTWPLSTAACERGFSSMNRTKTIQRSSLATRTLDNNLRISVKYHSLNKSERVKAFAQSGHLANAVKHWRENSVRARRENWVDKHPEARTWSSLKGTKPKD